MRERLDCALFSTRSDQAWVASWQGSHAGGRLHCHVLHDPLDIDGVDAVQVLARSAMHLQRFDVCLMRVSPYNLAWVRQALLAAKDTVKTPILASIHDLTAGAIDDLYALGLADFVRDPLCTEELRARIERLLDGRRYNADQTVAARSMVGEASTSYRASAPGMPGKMEEALCQTILDRSGMELEAFAIASASRCATTRESFRLAKSQVIERFERAYITAALGRHSGNIAMAARAAQKHRRAFWALMRKHDIDAAPFRRDPHPNIPRDG